MKELPWRAGERPLMLAPMQGVTNRGLRALFIEKFHPDLVFTEYVRVQAGAKKGISGSDRLEVLSGDSSTPLVVQLIGSDPEALAGAADTVQALGVCHLNINLGCPYGRMTGNSAGGSLLKDRAAVERILVRLRPRINGSFSVKTRAGFDDPSEIYSLLDLFADCGVDFLIVHPRTVRQCYSGQADHRVTAEVVRRSTLPVIANGDIFTAEVGWKVFQETGAAGLMLGRGAIADPYLFERLRGRYPAVSGPEARGRELKEYLQGLLQEYQRIFSGQQQILAKMKEVLALIRDPGFSGQIKALKKCRQLDRFNELLAGISLSQ